MEPQPNANGGDRFDHPRPASAVDHDRPAVGDRILRGAAAFISDSVGNVARDFRSTDDLAFLIF